MSRWNLPRWKRLYCHSKLTDSRVDKFSRKQSISARRTCRRHYAGRGKRPCLMHQKSQTSLADALHRLQDPRVQSTGHLGCMLMSLRMRSKPACRRGMEDASSFFAWSLPATIRLCWTRDLSSSDRTCFLREPFWKASHAVRFHVYCKSLLKAVGSLGMLLLCPTGFRIISRMLRWSTFLRMWTLRPTSY